MLLYRDRIVQVISRSPDPNQRVCNLHADELCRKNLSVTELTETLRRMSEKLDAMNDCLHQNHSLDRCPTNLRLRSSNTSLGPTSTPVISPLFADPARTYASSPPFLDDGRFQEDISLSQKHLTAPQHLLSWECSPLKMSEYELNYPIDLEIKRTALTRSTYAPKCLAPPIPSDHWVSRLSHPQLTFITQFYFAHFHPSCLILDEAKFYAHDLNYALRNGISYGIESCLVLLVSALGSIAACHMGHDEWVQVNDNEDGQVDLAGLGFFNLACNAFRDVEAADWQSVQCLLLTG